jgi:aspartate/methionine/tyrosine aminotransferase
VRKHAGFMVPWPVQRALVAGLSEDAHVAAIKDRYAARRALLKPAVEAWGLRVDDSQAGLYLWSSAGEDSWTTVGKLADLGILVAPGAFYGAAGAQHVRVALTGTDERIAAAVTRLAASPA